MILLRFILVFCIFLASEAYALDARLVLTNNDNGKELLVVPVSKDENFCIKYTHSVALSIVEDWFSINTDGIFLEKTIYADFGAGLPHDVDSGQIMTFKDGKIFINGLHRKVSPFAVRVGRIANHILLINNKEIPLSSLIDKGKAITFSVREQ